MQQVIRKATKDEIKAIDNKAWPWHYGMKSGDVIKITLYHDGELTRLGMITSQPNKVFMKLRPRTKYGSFATNAEWYLWKDLSEVEKQAPRWGI